MKVMNRNTNTETDPKDPGSPREQKKTFGSALVKVGLMLSRHWHALLILVV